MAARSVVFEIAGERLKLRTDRSDAFVSELEALVSSEVQKVRSAAGTMPRQQVYLMVALMLADELLANRDANKSRAEVLKVRSMRLLEFVEGELSALDEPT
jgi:cell division protein ZapA (FtsZ GTPase activity inhibitor)